MAIVPYRGPGQLVPGQKAAPLTLARVVPPLTSTQAGALAQLAPVSLPGSWTPDPLGPVSPAARMVKGHIELAATGGSEPGGMGIAPSAGPGSWSDDRMPFQRAHFIPYAMGGLQSAQLGGLGAGGQGQVPVGYAPWIGAPGAVASMTKPDMSDQLTGLRSPQSLARPTMQPMLPGELGGPYVLGSGAVLPAQGVDPYGSLPAFLQAPLTGGPAGMSGLP